MSFKSRIRSQAMRLVGGRGTQSAQRLTAELGRRISGRPHDVSVFLQLDDPYSYLLSLYLPALEKRYDITLSVCLSQALGDGYAPEPALLAEYAVADCRLLAGELGVPFLDKGKTPVVEHRRALCDLLARDDGTREFPARLCAALSAYWRGDSEGVARMVEGFPPDGRANAVIERNQARLRKLGHYQSAMLHYGGEWYWGVDRLHHLLSRLDELGLARSDAPAAGLASIAQAMQLSLPATAPASAERLPPLELFCSFRSPYSWLALGRAVRIADAFGLRLVFRPVLPMVSRGLALPRTKALYIVRDAKREARRLQVPFERFFDPLGAGAERCLAVFAYARTQHREREFMLSAGNAIWNEGVDVATDDGMRAVTEKAGLFWPDVVAAMQDEGWRDMAEANRVALSEAGMWGVPTFRFGDVVLWGQDRDWLLARQIEDRCQDGEGILI